MNFLTSTITDYLVNKGFIEKEDYDVYEYGLLCFFEILTSIICSIIIAVIMNSVIECLLFFFFFIPLRSLWGGLHMEKYFNCLLFSCLTLITIFLLVKYVDANALLSFLLFTVSLIFLKALGPVNHPNRTVNSDEDFTFTRRFNKLLILHLLIGILFLIASQRKYLFVEALVYVLVVLTSILGKIKYHKESV